MIDCRNISLTETEIIRLLIKNRSKIDKMHQNKLLESKSIFVFNDNELFIEDVEVVYLDLERLIKNTRLNDKQRYIIKHMMFGFEEQDIAEKMGWTLDNVIRVLDASCRKIKEENDFEWREWLETSGLIKVAGEYKQCVKCKRWLRANSENFSPHKEGKDDLHTYCKSCRR